MNAFLISLGQWLESTSYGTWVRNTVWGFPWVLWVHFTGLALWVGTIVTLDLRLLGVVARRHTVAEFSDEVFPWTWTGLAIAVIGGFFLFSGIAATYVQNPAFRFKIPLVLIGIAYHIVVLRKIDKWSRPPVTPPLAKVAGLIEMALWLVVVTAAVYIPNY